MENGCILVVDDDKDIVAAIAKLLEKEDFEVIRAYDGLDALDKLASNRNINLILIDIMMPKLDGLSAMMKIRATRNIPILVLSAKSEDTDKVLGLSMGADDYITKPYNPMELVARVKSNLRRYLHLGSADTNKTDIIKIGGLALDTSAKTLEVDGEQVKLTATELKIMELLMRNAGRIFSAEEIYSKVWNEDAYAVENTVMVHIRHIREKIEINPREPKYLKVVWGIGYKIEKSDTEELNEGSNNEKKKNFGRFKAVLTSGMMRTLAFLLTCAMGVCILGWAFQHDENGNNSGYFFEDRYTSSEEFISSKNNLYQALCTTATVYLRNCKNGEFQGSEDLYKNFMRALKSYEYSNIINIYSNNRTPVIESSFLITMFASVTA